MCARHGRGAIEICLSEKGALAKKDWETLLYSIKNLRFAKLRVTWNGELPLHQGCITLCYCRPHYFNFMKYGRQ